jgi:hypothetical protein
VLNVAFNAVASLSRTNHTKKDYLQAETTRGKEELEVEAEVFGLKQRRSPTPDDSRTASAETAA